MNHNARPRYPPGIGNGRGGHYAQQNPNFQSRPPYNHQQHHNQPHYMKKNSPQQNQYQNQQQQQQQQWMMRRPANSNAAATTTATSAVDSTQSTFNEVDDTVQAPQSVDSRYFSFPPNFIALLFDI